MEQVNDNLPTTETNENKNSLILPYAGQKGELITRKLKKDLKNILPSETEIVFTGTKLSSFFSCKDTTKSEHQHDLIYYAKCPEETCNAN